MPRASIVAANWKMNGSPQMTREMVTKLSQYPIEQLSTQVVICPPALYISQLVDSKLPVEVGGQNCSEYKDGAYTGEVSSLMLQQSGCRYVIVGHSERRQMYGETDLQVAAKTKRALADGLVPIVCVGETLEQREAGQTLATVTAQLDAAIEAVDNVRVARVVLAYEPIWAIGTGKTASPQQAQEVHAALRESLRERGVDIAESMSILYGGSVKAANANELFAQPDIDGGLIGGASLDAQEFFEICKAAG